MRSASSLKFASLTLLASMLVPGAFALPTITDWSVVNDGKAEKVEIHWSESAPVEISQFAQARQVIAVIPGAAVQQGTPLRLNTSRSHLLDRARLQEVTLPDGQKGVQITLELNEWTQLTEKATPDGYVLSLDMPAAAQPLARPADDGLILTDDKVEEMSQRPFGAFEAPDTGAGQAPTAGKSTLGNYFVPDSPGEVDAAMTAGMGLDDLAVQSKLNKNVRRVDFQGTSLENVLRLISEEAELNIMITPADVAGRTVTLRLRDVTLRQMLDAILKANELGYTVEAGGIVRIVPREQVKSTARETVTRTIAINWVNAADIKDALEPFIDTRQESDGAIEVLEATNTIVVRDVPETVSEVQELVRQLDTPEMQVLIEMRLVNMTENAARQFGVRTGYESNSTENRYARDPRNGNFFDTQGYANTNYTRNNNNIFESENSRENTSDITNSLEDTFTSFLGGAFLGQTTAESSIENTSNLTNDLTNTVNNNSSSTSEFFSTPSSRAAMGLLAPQATAFQLSNLFTADILGAKYDVDLQLNAEENRGEAVTLANPVVLSLNNQQASVEIRRQVPYQSAVNTDQGSVATVEFQELGTNVQIIPRITNNGYVMMSIAPEQIIDRGSSGIGGARLTDETRLRASVIVPDEMTVALGGLREFSAISSEAGVPFLLRIPVLSWLFKNQTNQQDKTELYLFVTPQIVRDPSLSPYQTSLYEKIDYNWDLPDYYFDEVMPRKSPAERAGETGRSK